MKSKSVKIPKSYSTYNIHFRLERMYILQQETGSIDDMTKASIDPNHHDPLEHSRPLKYGGLTLPPYWYSSIHRMQAEKIRSHKKKKEGSMSKSELNSIISKRWREVEPDVKEYCRKLSIAERVKHACDQQLQDEPTMEPIRDVTISDFVSGDDAPISIAEGGSAVSEICTQACSLRSDACPDSPCSLVALEIDATLNEDDLEFELFANTDFNFSGDTF